LVKWENKRQARALPILASRHKNVANGSHLDPTFDEIQTHTEGNRHTKTEKP